MVRSHLVHFWDVELGGVLFQSDSLVARLEVRHHLREAPFHLFATDEANHPCRFGLQARVFGQVVANRDAVRGDVTKQLLLVVKLGSGASASLFLALVLASSEPGDHGGCSTSLLGKTCNQ